MNLSARCCLGEEASLTDIAARDVVSLVPDASIGEAASIMVERRLPYIVVTDKGGHPAGLVTGHEMLRAMLAAHPPETLLREVMSAPVLTIQSGYTINQATERMLAAGASHLVVVDAAGKMTGLLNEHDLVHALTLGKKCDSQMAEGALLRTLMDTIPDMVWLKDTNGVYLACNPRFEFFFGAKEKNIVGKTDYDFVDKELADICRVHDRLAMSKGEPVPNEGWLTFAGDGHRELLETIKTPMRNNWGDLIGVLGIARDITARMQTETALAESEHRYRVLVENSPFCIHEIDLQGCFQSINRAGLKMLGLDGEENICGVSCLSLVSGQDSGRIEALLRDALNGTVSYFEFVTAQEEPRHFKSCFIPIKDAGGKVLKLMGISEDITVSKRSEDALRITASVFDNSQEAIVITDAKNVILDVNPAFIRITGYSREEVLGQNPKLLSARRHTPAFFAAMWQSLGQEKFWRGEMWNRRKSGEVYAALLSIAAVCDNAGRILRYVSVFSDINYLKKHEAELSRVAYYDALTGVPNRVLLADRMKQAIARAARERSMLAVCYLDLDGFKQINDNLGHEAGDLVLVEVARRIGATIRGGDTVARLGGDEFVVLLAGLERGEECATTLDRMLAAIAQPITVKDQLSAVSASIGVSLYPLDDEDHETLLRHADQAMYVAKQSGKNRYNIYDPALDLRARSQHEFLKSIRHALENGQFELYYQPKVNLQSRRLAGAEALIRWQHHERGLLVPAEFLRLIESTKLEIEVGDWVIATALAQIDQWHRAGLDIDVSINISAHHLESPCFVEKLRQQLAHYPGMPQGRLQIEVLETAALNDFAIVREIIEACRELGVKFALDDFGTGYSSLSYLSSLPVDELKIDQTFVRDMLEDKGDMAIVHGIIALAQAFDHRVVAEGIETEAQYRALLDMGCETGQGFGIARPMPADKFRNWKAG